MNGKFFFSVSPPPRFLETNSYSENGKNYLLFNFFLNEKPVLVFWNKNLLRLLIVPDNNSDLVNQFKNAKKTDIFYTSFANLQFKPNFITFNNETYNGLVIKDTSQIQKTTKSQLSYPELTFKVVKNQGFKGMGEGYKPENKFLELEVEPLDLGIEGLPKITKIIFYFFNTPEPLATDKALNMEEYEKLFLDAEGKEYSVELKKLIFGDRLKAKIGKKLDYNALTFCSESEVGGIKAKSSANKKKDNNNFSEGNNNNSKTLKTVLIIGGVIIGLILVIFLFYWIWKKVHSLRK